ncbi:MAG: PhoX family protein [Sandaracinaceae bacterium]|nr:PhoX family protein [Sandaracinaceae bacterium]
MTERTMGRRGWLAGAGLAAAAVPVGLWLSRRGPDAPSRSRHGALRPDPGGVLDLLEGFSYRVLERAGDLMSDGQRVPARPDGMACMRGSDGSLVLMRNHELPGGLMGRLFGERAVAAAYDTTAAGGVTRVVLDPRTLERRSSNLVLAGTVLNCAGGPSPWGWLSCEETTARDHGYVFLCDPDAESAREPVRVDAYGRFKHEAAAVDPARAVAYLTEDEVDSCVYRFVPHDPARPFEGGSLRSSCAAARGRAPPRGGPASAWRSSGSSSGPSLPAASCATTRSPSGPRSSVAARAPAPPAARSTSRRPSAARRRRARSSVSRTRATAARSRCSRPRRIGRRWTCRTTSPSRRTARSSSPRTARARTTCAASPSAARSSSSARNAASDGEITGVCFSPDGRAMFLNLQEDGLTLVVEGPFDRLA